MISPTDLLTQFAVNIITTLFGVQDPSDENDDEIDDILTSFLTILTNIYIEEMIIIMY